MSNVMMLLHALYMPHLCGSPKPTKSILTLVVGLDLSIFSWECVSYTLANKMPTFVY